ncbi:hypothetical protein HS99_0001765 [Kitasatospora aureofaciens]|uniref:Cation-transporting P-type ATPase N-terminal domain-containing protein n=1 Tax=Kitasatospora aureofaciens TaxID=1894 RepID=A0A1E7NFK5_KITAU|nr:hypothetical protein HS99_0001765 [Kitasatospora aureofaciens]
MTVAACAPAHGLTATEAARRLAEHGPNEVTADHRVPLWARIAAQLRDPLITVLLSAVALTLAIGDHPDAVVIALVIVVNTTVGVVQEVRAESAVAALSRLSAPAARVLRDGEHRKVPSAGIVPGDVVALAEGDIVPADARLVESAALLVDESMLTGESLPVTKAVEAAAPGDETVRAGTIVLRGRALAVVTATGAESALGRIAALLRPWPEPTPLQRRLAGLGRVLAAVAVGLCAVVFVLGLLRHQPPGEMGVTVISLAVAAVPESLPAVVTLALAMGARRMAARHAVVRRLPAVETLGSVSVLATDKTGTLTEGRMVVERLWTPHSTAVVTGLGYGPAGGIRLDGTADDEVKGLLTTAALCNDAALRPPTGGDGEWGALADPTEAALLTAAGKAGLDHERLRGRCGRARSFGSTCSPTASPASPWAPSRSPPAQWPGPRDRRASTSWAPGSGSGCCCSASSSRPPRSALLSGPAAAKAVGRACCSSPCWPPSSVSCWACANVC